MIYIFIIVTVVFAVSWGNKLIQGVDSKADELSLRTMPLTLILLILILCLFGAKDWSAMHLFYVYPVTFWVGQFCLGLS